MYIAGTSSPYYRTADSTGRGGGFSSSLRHPGPVCVSPAPLSPLMSAVHVQDALLRYGRDYSRVHLTPQFLHWAHSLLRQHASPLAISIYNQPLPPMVESHSPARGRGRPPKASSGKGKEKDGQGGKSRRTASPEPDARPAATQSPTRKSPTRKSPTKPSATAKQSGKQSGKKTKAAAEAPSPRKTRKDKEMGDAKGKGKKKRPEEEEEEEEEESDEGPQNKAVQAQKGRGRRHLSPSAPRRATRSTSANVPVSSRLRNRRCPLRVPALLDLPLCVSATAGCSALQDEEASQGCTQARLAHPRPQEARATVRIGLGGVRVGGRGRRRGGARKASEEVRAEGRARRLAPQDTAAAG
jgi:hypothetical protein